MKSMRLLCFLACLLLVVSCGSPDFVGKENTYFCLPSFSYFYGNAGESQRILVWLTAIGDEVDSLAVYSENVQIDSVTTLDKYVIEPEVSIYEILINVQLPDPGVTDIQNLQMSINGSKIESYYIGNYRFESVEQAFLDIKVKEIVNHSVRFGVVNAQEYSLAFQYDGKEPIYLSGLHHSLAEYRNPEIYFSFDGKEWESRKEPLIQPNQIIHLTATYEISDTDSGYQLIQFRPGLSTMADNGHEQILSIPSGTQVLKTSLEKISLETILNFRPGQRK